MFFIVKYKSVNKCSLFFARKLHVIRYSNCHKDDIGFCIIFYGRTCCNVWKGVVMGEVENVLSEVYKWIHNCDEQYFVALQKAYIMLFRAYCKNSDGHNYNNDESIKEYLYFKEKLEDAGISNEEMLLFQKMWRKAENVEKRVVKNEVFDVDDALMYARRYNDIVDKLLARKSLKYKLDISKFLFPQQSEGSRVDAEGAVKKEIERIEKQRIKKTKSENLCPECGAKMIRRDGPYVTFWGCSNYFKTGCKGKREYGKTFTDKPQRYSGSSTPEFRQYEQRTQWFVAREREKGGKVKFMQSLGVGYELLRLLQEDSELYDDYRRCSHWRFDYKTYEKKAVDEELRHVAALAYKLLTRGKITLLSPKVEKFILSTFKNETGKAECLLNYQNRHENPLFWLDGSGTEKCFYNEILPAIFGSGYEHYVIPQVHLSSLVYAEEDIGNQRVDFAINDGKNKIVIELDDSSHEEHKEYDNKRDECLEDAGFKVFRVPNSEVELESENIKQLINSFKIPQSNNLELQSAKGVIVGKIIHQIEIVIVYGIMHGIFTSDEHIILDLDASIFKAEETREISEIILADINEFFSRIADLYSLPIKFNINLTLEEKNTELDKLCKEISYNTEKRATENRVIISDFAYEQDFVNYSPRYGEVGYYSGNEETLLYFLNYFFRKERFREGQFEGVSNVLNKIDSLLLLPTGAGKSITFQLASLLTAGIVFVVSPLVSLMMDQVENLKQYGIDRVKAFAGSLSDVEKTEMNNLIISGNSIITYISPERLQIQSFRDVIENTLEEIPVPMFVIDEAHCLSEWGHDFRTSYLNLGRIIREHCKFNGTEPIIMALTGTASDNVANDVRNQLDIWKDGSLITPNKFDREELNYHIIECETKEKRQNLLETLEKLPSKFDVEQETFYSLKGEKTFSGLIFCPYVNGEFGTHKIRRILSDNEYSCKEYSGSPPKSSGKSKEEWEEKKRKAADDFKHNKCHMLVATKAYGMGIDKSNIRFIIHYNTPATIEAYYQEVGRAGRDRSQAMCILLASLDDNGEDDRDRVEYFHKKTYEGEKTELKYIKIMYNKLWDTSEGFKKKNFYITLEGKKDDTKAEKALYRLLLIGVIDDYTKTRLNEYYIHMSNVIPEKVRKAFEECIAKYHEGRVNSEIAKLNNLSDDDIKEYIIAVAGILMDFIYDNIVRGRKEAIASMFDLVKRAIKEEDQNAYMHREIESYLASDEKEAIGIILNGERAALKESAEFFINGEYQNLNAIRGQLTRQIESHPDHPGLILTRAFIDSSRGDSNFDEDDVVKEINIGFKYAKERYSATAEDTEEYFKWMLKEINKKNPAFALKICQAMKNIYSAEKMLEIVAGIITNTKDIEILKYRYLVEFSDEIVRIAGGE